MKGFVHIYTGNGKGKTTAAFGLALRALGASKKVFIAQFVKGKMYNEIRAIRKYLPDIKIVQYGLGCFIIDTPGETDFKVAQEGIAEVKKVISSGKYDLIILDEIFIALFYKLIDNLEIIDIIKNKPFETELVLTGRYASEDIISLADLVTEMKEVKHYYTKGIEAREGIEF